MHNPKLDLTLDRVLDVPPETAWRAWTDPQLLKQWFCPRPGRAMAIRSPGRHAP